MAIPSSLASVGADGSRRAIHPSDVHGRFIRARTWVFASLIAFYVALPFLKLGGHPVIHLDVPARKFYLFGATFNAQDFWLVLFLVTTVSFTLLFLTAWVGRVWCGWACPQTVFLEFFYRRVERWIDGSRERRLRIEKGGWSAGRVGRATLKHALYLGISAALAHVALALFIPLPTLVAMVTQGPAEHLVPFTWAVVVTLALYFNYAWFREQLCIAICPYGRLQSMMIDRDSLIVGYDARRGDPRAKLFKAAARTLTPPPAGSDHGAAVLPLRVLGAPSSGGDLRVEVSPAAFALPQLAAAQPGDCVDCTRCVTVCPMGIDIRNGLQMECIACAQCVDACDEVMIKIGRPTGLIRYDSLYGLLGSARQVLRPRLLVYGGMLAASVVALVSGLALRTPFEANLLRMAGAPFEVDGAALRNRFELHLMNKGSASAHYAISVRADREVAAIIPQPLLELGSLQGHRMPLVLSVPAASVHGPFPVTIEVREVESGEIIAAEGKFLAPPAPPRS
ncbi:MAG: 4Fe-4S binding protein [Myxococcota bacterium]|nr:4Fe-4S binding protein [Myxococcota bacterium]